MVDHTEIVELDLATDIIDQDLTSAVVGLDVYADVITPDASTMTPKPSPMTSLLPDNDVYCAQEHNFEVIDPTYEVEIVDLSLTGNPC